jgi:peptidoglycan/xylan/chitin deacetylase (PgdA/CDA1 family)
VVLTFDDGYRDLLEVCAPVLARYSFPATVYLPTGCISRQEPPWIDTIYNAFTSRTRHALHVPDADIPPTVIDKSEKATHVYRHLTSRLIMAGLGRRRRVLEAVETQLRPATRPPRLVMTWDEVRLLRDEYPLIDIGVHTIDHVDLTACPPEELHHQTAGAAVEAARELGCAPQHFSCPYGRCSPAVSQSLRECGYRSVVADGTQVLIQAGADRLALGRVTVVPSMSLFGYFTSGAYPRMSDLLLRRS